MAAPQIQLVELSVLLVALSREVGARNILRIIFSRYPLILRSFRVEALRISSSESTDALIHAAHVHHRLLIASRRVVLALLVTMAHRVNLAVSASTT